MKIFRSQIEVFKEGEKTPKVFELVVEHGEILEDEERFRMFTLGNQVDFYAIDQDAKAVKCNIEDYKDEPFYDFLKRKEYEYIQYVPDVDTQYVINVLERNYAQDYLDFDTYNTQTSLKYEQLDKFEGINVIVYTYELDLERIQSELLDLNELVDLTDQSLDKILCTMLEDKILEEAKFLKSIKVKRSLSGKQEYYEIIKINGKKCEEFYINGLPKTTLRSDIAVGIPLIYFKGKVVVEEYSSNPMRFFEDENAQEILVIAGRRKYSAKETAEVFEAGIYDTYKKAVVCVTSKTNIEHML